MKRFILLGKSTTGLFWLLVLYNLVRPFAEPLGLILLIGGPGIIFIHLTQAYYFIRKFKMIQELSTHAFLVLVFGVFHMLEIREQMRSAE